MGYSADTGAFTAPCKKCNGSGVFVSMMSGRIVGPCYTCKGKRTVTYKTSPEARARATERRNDRAERDREHYRQCFAQSHPEVWAWIIESESTFDFARSMREAIERFGDLTANQLAACERALAKRELRRMEREERELNAPAIDTGGLDRLMSAFNAASATGLKRPVMRFDGFSASLAPISGKNAGAVYIKAGETYLGKIQGGKFHASRECSSDLSARVNDTMRDPLAAAVAYGKRTGNCSICGRYLENAESVARGIGPVCAERFGLL